MVVDFISSYGPFTLNCLNGKAARLVVSRAVRANQLGVSRAVRASRAFRASRAVRAS